MLSNSNMSQSSLSGLLLPLVTLFVGAGLAGTGCDSKGGSSKAEKQAQKGGIGAQVAAGSKKAKKKKKGGTASIDHHGITEVPTDPELIEKGKKAFNENGCQACHKMHEKQVGPPLGGVTERRSAKWIAKMIQHPQEMLRKDPQAKELLKEYGTRMANQNVSPEDTEAIIAYLGSVESKGNGGGK